MTDLMMSMSSLAWWGGMHFGHGFGGGHLFYGGWGNGMGWFGMLGFVFLVMDDC